MLRVLIIEDDPIYADMLQLTLKREFRDVETRLITSEKQFREDFQEIESYRPDLVFLDILLRWSNARLEAIRPSSAGSHGFYRSGLRCLRSMQESNELREIPVIIHSILTRDDLKDELNQLPVNVFFFDKNRTTLELLPFVHSVATRLPEENPNKTSISSKVVEAAEIKPSWFGIGINLKSLFKRNK